MPYKVTNDNEAHPCGPPLSRPSPARFAAPRARVSCRSFRSGGSFCMGRSFDRNEATSPVEKEEGENDRLAVFVQRKILEHQVVPGHTGRWLSMAACVFLTDGCPPPPLCPLHTMQPSLSRLLQAFLTPVCCTALALHVGWCRSA